MLGAISSPFFARLVARRKGRWLGVADEFGCVANVGLGKVMVLNSFDAGGNGLGAVPVELYQGMAGGAGCVVCIHGLLVPKAMWCQ
jgi:hypothetical protein